MQLNGLLTTRSTGALSESHLRGSACEPLRIRPQSHFILLGSGTRTTISFLLFLFKSDYPVVCLTLLISVLSAFGFL